MIKFTEKERNVLRQFDRAGEGAYFEIALNIMNEHKGVHLVHSDGSKEKINMKTWEKLWSRHIVMALKKNSIEWLPERKGGVVKLYRCVPFPYVLEEI